MVSVHKHNWPAYDIRQNPSFETRFKPFIDDGMAKLARLDRERAVWVSQNLPSDYRMTYIFHEHAARVADDMRQTALHLGLPPETAETLYWAMLPHDIGKSVLPADIWDRVDKPDAALKTLRRSHTERGVQLLRTTLPEPHPFLDLTADIMRNHHEQLDGGGLHKVKADNLSAPVRLACIVESFDGYATERPHFGDRDISTAGVLRRMRDEKGAALYDMDLFEAFADMKMRAAHQGGTL